MSRLLLELPASHPLHNRKSDLRGVLAGRLFLFRRGLAWLGLLHGRTVARVRSCGKSKHGSFAGSCAAILVNTCSPLRLRSGAGVGFGLGSGDRTQAGARFVSHTISGQGMQTPRRGGIGEGRGCVAAFGALRIASRRWRISSASFFLSMPPIGTAPLIRQRGFQTDPLPAGNGS